MLGGLGALVLAAISARIFRRRAVAIATGFAAGLHPGLVMVALDVQSEPLFVLLLLVSGFLLLVAADRPSSNLALAAGAALALAALTRPSALALAPLLGAFLLDVRQPLRARAHLAASALLGFVLALAPWTIRNALVYRELIPVNDAAGSAFYQGNSDWTVAFYEIGSLAEYRDWSAAMFGALERETRAVEAETPGSPTALSRHFVRKALAERSARPGTWGPLLLRKSWDWLRPYPHPLFWPPAAVWLVGAVNAALALLAVRGLVLAPRPGVRAFVLAYLAVAFLVHVLLIVVWRYRIAYWDPVVLLYAVPGAMARR